MADNYTATVNGITVSADSPENLSKAVASIRGVGEPPKPRKPKPKLENPVTQPYTQPPKTAEPPAKWNAEKLVEELARDPQGAILSILDQALGFNFKEQLGAIDQKAATGIFLSARSSAVSALKANNIPVTNENIIELTNLLQARKGDQSLKMPTLDNYESMAAEAAQEEWLEVAKSTKPEPKQQQQQNQGDPDLHEAEPGGGTDFFPDFEQEPLGEGDNSASAKEVAEFAETAPLEKLQAMLANVGS